jgi:hypothetical protein
VGLEFFVKTRLGASRKIRWHLAQTGAASYWDNIVNSVTIYQALPQYAPNRHGNQNF